MALSTWSLRPLRSVRACGRVLGLLWHVLQGLWLVTWRFPRYSPAQQQAQGEKQMFERHGRLRLYYLRLGINH